MSYDLYFTQPEITWDQFEDYFRGRACYTLNKNQAWYENKDTDVYFSFVYSADPPADPEAPEWRVSFNLNFFRPHIFALEAEPELRAFVDHFNFRIFDPQLEGLGEDAYRTEGFLRGWNYGNEFSYQAILTPESCPAVVHARPQEELEAIWKWNYAREQLQNKLGDGIFVPKIFYHDNGHQLNTAIVWPDAISTLIPEVETLAIRRKETAPRRLFRRREGWCFIPFHQASSILQPFKTSDFLLPSYLLPSPKTPANVIEFVKKLAPRNLKPVGVPIDQVLNSEIVNKYRKG